MIDLTKRLENVNGKTIKDQYPHFCPFCFHLYDGKYRKTITKHYEYFRHLIYTALKHLQTFISFWRNKEQSKSMQTNRTNL